MRNISRNKKLKRWQLLKLYPCFFGWQSLVGLALFGLAGFLAGRLRSVFHNIYRPDLSGFQWCKDAPRQHPASEENYNG